MEQISSGTESEMFVSEKIKMREAKSEAAQQPTKAN
jgi:hypothetical protein